MKKLLLLFAIFTSILTANAQTGSIRGTIKTSDGQPAQFVGVGLKGTTKGALTNSSGEFEIKKVEAGSYTLITSLVGMEAKEQPVVVTADETLNVPEIILNVNTQQLNEVSIQAARNRKESPYVAKMPLKNIENPQVYNTVDSKVLKEQVVTNFEDALKNAPGVEKLWESTGRGGDGGGFYSMRGFAVQPTMVNGLPGLTNGSLDPANIERIEVLKGPSGTLFGSSLISYGGLINTVTKKPYNTFGGEISYITGSYGLNRISADVNTPLNKDNNLNFRLNTAYHTENSFQDAGFRKSLLTAPSLSYRVNDRLSFLVLTEFLSAESTNPTMLFLNRGGKLTAPNLEALGYDYKRSYTSNNLSIKTPSANLQAQMNYNLSENWTSQTVFSSGSSTSNGYYSYLYESTGDLPIEGSVFTRYANRQNANTVTSDIQQNFIGNFQLGNNINNKIVAGLDYYQNTATNNSTGYVTNGKVYIGNTYPDSIVYDAVFDSVRTPTYDSGILSDAAMASLLANSQISNSKSRNATYSAYVSDVISFEKIGFSAMASLRVDHFYTEGEITDKEDDFSQTALSPKFGLVYQPVKDKVSIFANYMNGFSNVAPIQVTELNGKSSTKTFEPEQANQLEYGIKTNLLDNRITASVSYYDIKVKNKVMPDYAEPLNTVQGGEVESKGIELDLNASPVKGLDMIVGFAHNDSKVIKAEKDNVFSPVGRRLSDAGPENLFNAWATYRLTSGTLNGLGVGFGANYASERLILDSEVTGTFAVPAYTVFNGSVFYNAPSFRIILKVDNLTNKEYYKGWSTINPQRPRSVSASFSYLF